MVYLYSIYIFDPELYCLPVLYDVLFEFVLHVKIRTYLHTYTNNNMNCQIDGVLFNLRNLLTSGYAFIAIHHMHR